MRRIFEWIGGFALIAFSFYFTDKVSLLVASKSELMQEIQTVSANYEVEPVDAKIEDESIIPGKYGKKVDDKESYLSMHEFGSFNENYLVFDYLKPKNSLEDNKDKFIISGNPDNRNISIISLGNKDIENYLNSEKIDYDLVVTEYIKNPENVELINGADTKELFNKLDSQLETKICLNNESDIDSCKKRSYYLLNPEKSLNGTNLITLKDSIASGDIILITSGAKLEDFMLLKKEIEYKDLNIVFVSKLISEKS